MNIDRHTYDKTRYCRPGQGYKLRLGAWPGRIIVHTTNGHEGSRFENEARYIANSPNIGAHYLVGKQGQVVRFLDPVYYIAYHAGLTKWGWGNAHTIGIECHYTPGEGLWPDAMTNALEDLILEIAIKFPVGDFTTEVRTHRWAALPPGRKVDPSGFPDAEFVRWRETLQVRRVSMLEAA